MRWKFGFGAEEAVQTRRMYEYLKGKKISMWWWNASAHRNEQFMFELDESAHNACNEYKEEFMAVIRQVCV